MNDTAPERLFFWHFFHSIEDVLGYERWIEKYHLFVAAISGNQIAFDDDWQSFRQFCKILYLQDYHDEPRFDALLDEAIQLEKTKLLAFLQARRRQTGPEPAPGDVQESSDPIVNDKPEIQSDVAIADEKDDTDVEVNVQRKAPKTSSTAPETKYFRPLPEDNLFDGGRESRAGTNAYRFLHTDEYFPVTRRQMIKAWQYLRRTEKRGNSERLDIPGTVRHIAREGMLLEPVFHPGLYNRPDTLMLLADCRGSMTPFHEFTRRLIQTARTEGGHPKAPVYYFKNYPAGYLYKQPNLSEPVKMKGALSHANPHSTLAIVISDAGAARSTLEPGRIDIRLKMTKLFLDVLHPGVAHVIWLNPVPEHRWAGTAAQEIRKLVAVMAPVFDENGQDMQSIIRLLLKHKLQIT